MKEMEITYKIVRDGLIIKEDRCVYFFPLTQPIKFYFCESETTVEILTPGRHCIFRMTLSKYNELIAEFTSYSR